MQLIQDIFKENKGYASLKELKKSGVHTKTIKKMIHDGIIEKVKPGFYKLVDMPLAAEQGLIDVCLAMPRAVICLFSALSYYEITTTVPSTVMIALPRGSKPSKILYPPIQVYYFSGKNYSSGIEKKETKFGDFRIYNIEKTIVDCFRFRKRLGDDIVLEGLKNYLSKPDYNVHKLLKYAKQGRVSNVMQPYLEAYLAK